MQHIKEFHLFESDSGLSQEQENFLTEHVEGTWSYDHQTGLVDVKGDFWGEGKGLTDLKGIRFGRVSGNFNCDRNNLTSLEGAPREVDGDFYCSENKLTSLEGAPREVDGDFWCERNNLTSLEEAPREVDGDFYCSENRLTSLDGAPQKVGGNFWCERNNLTSLVGAPREARRNFFCDRNNLTSLVGAPQKVVGDFFCRGNTLTSLEGAPLEVGGNFYCDDFEVSGRDWNPRGWLELVADGKSIVDPLLDPKWLNQEIQKEPTKWIVLLKGVWKSPDFAEIRQQLVVPERFHREMDLVGDLGDIGF